MIDQAEKNQNSVGSRSLGSPLLLSTPESYLDRGNNKSTTDSSRSQPTREPVLTNHSSPLDLTYADAAGIVSCSVLFCPVLF